MIALRPLSGASGSSWIGARTPSPGVQLRFRGSWSAALDKKNGTVKTVWTFQCSSLMALVIRGINDCEDDFEVYLRYMISYSYGRNMRTEYW